MLFLSRFLRALCRQWLEFKSESLTVALPDGAPVGVIGIVYGVAANGGNVPVLSHLLPQIELLHVAHHFEVGALLKPEHHPTPLALDSL